MELSAGEDAVVAHATRGHPLVIPHHGVLETGTRRDLGACTYDQVAA